MDSANKLWKETVKVASPLLERQQNHVAEDGSYCWLLVCDFYIFNLTSEHVASFNKTTVCKITYNFGEFEWGLLLTFKYDVSIREVLIERSKQTWVKITWDLAGMVHLSWKN